MRRLVVAMVAGALGMLAAAPAGTSLPEPIACADECEILAHGAGYVGPATMVQAGADVIWRSLDATHVNADGMGIADVADPCFTVAFSASRSSDPVTFDIVDGSLVATTNGESFTCDNARADPAGGFTLPYWCILHPNMRAALVILA